MDFQLFSIKEVPKDNVERYGIVEATKLENDVYN